ncbi:MAG TPA: class I SAM-dependent DNA methyltransferase [Cyanobacteria bacterium UBA11369]|nr:class I SAM-dependent DNA methyltransferase [Cyanobacteria bacterium UBA11371]HBE35519.1 class I SAM-dependent DNA methyltransferase [Cyanobacteria bacterium UBA11368]HBE51020.1 class I SAM-dependent DNA methyltransferase [Cyanobacteria bacterium UBA11369]
MNEVERQRVEKFLEKWLGSTGQERANKDSFFLDFCDALGVERPPAKGSVPDDPYCFEKDVKIPHPSGKVTTGFVDFYKSGHFIIEAKQGGETTGKGTAKRGTASYYKEMEKAFVQALAYSRNLATISPVILTCDIGSHFELWLGFNGDYGGYGARETIGLKELLKPEKFELFVDIFTQPQKRNPEKIAAKVTRELANDLAMLARSLETQPQTGKMPAPLQVASFLMRCIFTMFAEDVELLPEQLFTQGLKERWIPQPKRFKSEVEALWQAMNEGKSFGFSGKLLRFNGGLFADYSAFDLNAEQLQVLLQAAQRDWSKVEPAIFGTLLERALNPKERSKLGAHYTPRSYVERLVRPAILEPLRERWDLVQAEAKQILNNGEAEPTANQRKKAIVLIQDFLKELRELKILDPACGSGNFLYVTLDLLKTLESEILRRLADITGQEQLSLEFDQINPSQFLGIEINPRAAAIADLVIWIGYLQWHFKRFGNIPPTEPVLRAYNNIECRDAVLSYDGKEPAIDSGTNQPRTRWGGRTIKHPITGEDVPDPTDQIPIYQYFNPRPADWPDATYIVSNPPFIGNARMREILGDGYAETLRQTYQDVPDTVDYVMYWWHKAAELVRTGNIERFGYITTNSIRQVRQRKVIDFHLNQKNPIRLTFAIGDHPWVDGGAAVRIAMTAAELDDPKKPVKVVELISVIAEKEGETPEDSADSVKVRSQDARQIFSNLQAGADVTQAQALVSNRELASKGFELGSSGFIVPKEKVKTMEQKFIYPLLTGRDIAQKPQERYVIDANQLSEEELCLQYPRIYQWLLNNVKPDREINNDPRLRREWWRYRRSNAIMRNGIKGMNRYIVTPRTAKHRYFIFCSIDVIPESEVIVIFLENAYFLGILSSKTHIIWSLAAGGRLGVGNDPRYNNSVCFDPFPFPDATPEQKQKIRELGERLDAHRKRVQSQDADVTITGMYNLLEKLRSGKPFTDADRNYNDKALVSTLKQIHDQLDAAVLDAYGWPENISDEDILERLVALNAERAAAERNGIIRWLRPEYQAPAEIGNQIALAGINESEETATTTPVEQKTWPKKPKEQLAAIRDLLRSFGGEWTVEQVMAQFKGAQRQKKTISEHLESLETLGIILSRTEAGITRWHDAE